MKNTIIWICGILTGGLAGYGIGLFQSSSPYFWMAVGIIIGSTVAITYNIHREEEDLHDDLEENEIAGPEAENESQPQANQKTTS